MWNTELCIFINKCHLMCVVILWVCCEGFHKQINIEIYIAASGTCALSAGVFTWNSKVKCLNVEYRVVYILLIHVVCCHTNRNTCALSGGVELV
jgi:hypothetical protein